MACFVFVFVFVFGIDDLSDERGGSLPTFLFRPRSLTGKVVQREPLQGPQPNASITWVGFESRSSSEGLVHLLDLLRLYGCR